jgi:hypothetical protein
VNEIAPSLGLDEAGILEHSQVLGHGSRRDAREVRQRADAQAALRYELHYLHALLNGKRTEDSHHVSTVFPDHIL